MAISLRNEDIVGWRVKKRISSCCHVPDFSHPEGFRHVGIPAGIAGTLTGEITIFPEGVDSQSCQELVQDSRRLREVLQKEILPDLEENFKKGLDYWRQTESLTGDNLLASRICFQVCWDELSEQEPGTLNCRSYTPWLQLVENGEEA